MGFSVKTHVNTIRVPLTVNTFNNDTGESQTVDVAHIFRLPEVSEREKHQQLLVKVKGRKVKAGGTPEAHWYLWNQCCMKVEGYDDLPTDVNWKTAFDTPILRLHIEAAVEFLMNSLYAEEADTEKKFVLSSEP